MNGPSFRSGWAGVSVGAGSDGSVVRPACPINWDHRTTDALLRSGYVFDKYSADIFPERNRDRIADEAPECCKIRSLASGEERVIARESLQHSSLSQTDRAVLFGVSEASVPVTKTLSSNRRAWSVPFHSSVH